MFLILSYPLDAQTSPVGVGVLYSGSSGTVGPGLSSEPGSLGPALPRSTPPPAMLLSLIVLASCLATMQAKMCWQECADTNVIKTADIVGCRRRPSYPHGQDFRCTGTLGPPCIVQRGDTVHLGSTNIGSQQPGLAGRLLRSTNCTAIPSQMTDDYRC